MFNSLNKLGLPVKYAILCGIGAALGIIIFGALGFSDGTFTPLNALVAGAVGGAIGGWIRQRQGKSS